MDLQCPHCQFQQQVDDSALPERPCKVNCPRCKQSFVLAAQEVKKPAAVVAPPDVTPPPLPAAPTTEAVMQQPAGFWVRVLAAIIDSMVCNVIVFAMGFALGMLLNVNNVYVGPSIQMLLMLMGILVTLFYYVFFTGYCGQTPGKMAMHIKVVDKDGSDVSYGQAFVRETIGKTVSYLIFCIGYLMVAFRSDKRGLHDLMAATKVNKL